MCLFVLWHFGSKNEESGQAGEPGRDEGRGQVASVGGLSASRLGSATGPAPTHPQFEPKGVFSKM